MSSAGINAAMASVGQALDPLRMSQAMKNFQEMDQQRKANESVEKAHTEMLERAQNDPVFAKTYAEFQKMRPGWNKSKPKDFNRGRAELQAIMSTRGSIQKGIDAGFITPEYGNFLNTNSMMNPSGTMSQVGTHIAGTQAQQVKAQQDQAKAQAAAEAKKLEDQQELESLHNDKTNRISGVITTMDNIKREPGENNKAYAYRLVDAKDPEGGTYTFKDVGAVKRQLDAMDVEQGNLKGKVASSVLSVTQRVQGLAQNPDGSELFEATGEANEMAVKSPGFANKPAGMFIGNNNQLHTPKIKSVDGIPLEASVGATQFAYDPKTKEIMYKVGKTLSKDKKVAVDYISKMMASADEKDIAKYGKIRSSQDARGNRTTVIKDMDSRVKALTKMLGNAKDEQSKALIEEYLGQYTEALDRISEVKTVSVPMSIRVQGVSERTEQRRVSKPVGKQYSNAAAEDILALHELVAGEAVALATAYGAL
tara:strand:+ start:5001 stop:6440 length:1440 start_codon:yes stop_codon:yes gene_type:complete